LKWRGWVVCEILLIITKDELKRDGFRMNRHHALAFCLRMISAQTLRVCREGNRYTLFRIMRQGVNP
jgi:hypothetical protein